MPRTSRSPPRRPRGSAAPCSSSRSADRRATRCSPPPTRSRVIDRVRPTGPATSACSPTCTTWPSTATTSTRPSPHHADRIAHVQIADAPGRGEPGTGDLPLDRQLADLEAAGYDGWVGLEYKPTGPDRRQLRLAAAASVADALTSTDTSSETTHDMTNIAFIGLGIMGSPMAVHLAKAGHDVVGYNRTPDEDQAARRRRRPRRRLDRRRRRRRRGRRRHGARLPRRARRARRRGRRLRQRQARHARHRLLQHPPRRHRRARRQAAAQGLPAARRPGLRRRGRREERGAVDHGRRRRRGLRGGQADPRRRSARPSSTSAPAARARPSRPPTSSSSPPTSRRSPRRSSSSRPTASTPRPRSRCSAAAWPAPRCWTRRSRTCSTGRSSPGFRIDLHHKDMGIVTSAAREAGVVVPLGALVAQLMASARPTATAASTTPACCAASSGSSGKDVNHDPKMRARATPRWRSSRRRAPPTPSGCPARRSTRSTRRCGTHGGINTSSPGTSRAPRTWPRATPGPRPATSASASAPPARPAPT